MQAPARSGSFGEYVAADGGRGLDDALGASPDDFPAILVRLPAIDVDDLAELLTDAWPCQAPRALVKEFEQPPDD